MFPRCNSALLFGCRRMYFCVPFQACFSNDGTVSAVIDRSEKIFINHRKTLLQAKLFKPEYKPEIQAVNNICFSMFLFFFSFLDAGQTAWLNNRFVYSTTERLSVLSAQY